MAGANPYRFVWKLAVKRVDFRLFGGGVPEGVTFLRGWLETPPLSPGTTPDYPPCNQNSLTNHNPGGLPGGSRGGVPIDPRKSLFDPLIPGLIFGNLSVGRSSDPQKRALF